VLVEFDGHRRLPRQPLAGAEDEGDHRGHQAAMDHLVAAHREVSQGPIASRGPGSTIFRSDDISVTACRNGLNRGGYPPAARKSPSRGQWWSGGRAGSGCHGRSSVLRQVCSVHKIPTKILPPWIK